MQRLRPESSVALVFNDLDEIEFPCERSGPVKHLYAAPPRAAGSAREKAKRYIAHHTVL